MELRTSGPSCRAAAVRSRCCGCAATTTPTRPTGPRSPSLLDPEVRVADQLLGERPPEVTDPRCTWAAGAPGLAGIADPGERVDVAITGVERRLRSEAAPRRVAQDLVAVEPAVVRN